jgi:hypothetical protein
MTIVTEKTTRRVPPLGISKLSGLTIDVDKDQGGYKIKILDPSLTSNFCFPYQY